MRSEWSKVACSCKRSSEDTQWSNRFLGKVVCQSSGSSLTETESELAPRSPYWTSVCLVRSPGSLRNFFTGVVAWTGSSQLVITRPAGCSRWAEANQVGDHTPWWWAHAGPMAPLARRVWRPTLGTSIGHLLRLSPMHVLRAPLDSRRSLFRCRRAPPTMSCSNSQPSSEALSSGEQQTWLGLPGCLGRPSLTTRTSRPWAACGGRTVLFCPGPVLEPW